MSSIDLHVHTTVSDGTYTPSQVVALAKERGLSAIAITDHDIVAGYPEAAKTGAELGVEVIPGIEISTKYGGAVHILGYYVNLETESFKSVLNWILADREHRNRKMVDLMAADGLPITYEGMQDRFGEVIGRPHFARVLAELGLAADIKDAFNRYVEKGQKYYLPRQFMSIEQAVDTILKAGGIPVLAHPFQYKRDDAALRDLIEHCMKSGLRGMECRYSGYTAAQEAYLEALADEYGLIKTGGSDFHGSNKQHIGLGTGTGSLRVPYAFLEGLKREKFGECV